MKSTLANSSQLPLFSRNVPPSPTLYGPISINAPSILLQPGPPFSHITVRRLVPICRFWKCQKKRLPWCSGRTSIWPACIFRRGSGAPGREETKKSAAD